ncbi:MAG: dUTP diphosphatase [Fimbriimonadaceae bacterium]|nr:dUTP diphosphatase [Fimbriimonadaceae bacterium]
MLGSNGIEVPVVVDDQELLPTYESGGAAGMDVRLAEPLQLAPGQRTLAKTGLRLAIPDGYEAQVRPRSGLALRHGLTMVNSPGTIDSDYRGELGLIVINLGQDVVQLDKGTRIAQLVFAPVTRATLVPVGSLDETERGEGGFGSTGR